MEDECKPMLNTGLRGVVIADTRISDVQGAAGKLIYRGYLIQDLANSVSFEETAYLLLFEKLPNKAELKAFKAQLAADREMKFQLLLIFITRKPKKFSYLMMQLVLKNKKILERAAQLSQLS